MIFCTLMDDFRILYTKALKKKVVLTDFKFSQLSEDEQSLMCFSVCVELLF